MKTGNLRRRVRQLEAEGKAREAVAMLLRELGATKILKSPTENLTVPDYRRSMAAVLVISSILDPIPPEWNQTE